MRPRKRTAEVEDVRVKRMGLCHMHSMRYYRHGDPTVRLRSGPKGRR
jgi:hypothetical protein